MKRENKEVFVFDMDDTITLSNTKMDDEMIDLFCNLLKKKKVAIISGQSISNIERNVTSHLPYKEHLSNLFLLPNGGSRLLIYTDGDWKPEYSHDFTEEEGEKVLKAFRQALTEWGWKMEEHPEYKEEYGQILQNRGSSINFSAFGADAPREIKKAWDPAHKQRNEVVLILKNLIPDYIIKSAGTTTIDVTKKGIDKAFGVSELSKYLDIPLEKFVYIGDALYAGGNDEAILKLNIDTVDVFDNFDGDKQILKTKEFIRFLL